MDAFLLWIGGYNAAGGLVLAAMHDERVADTVLRRATEIIAQPYRHGDFGRLWLWWTATVQVGLGAVMLLATRWPAAAQREICIVVVAVYAAMYAVMVIGARKPRYGRGIWVAHGLWIAQIGWGSWAAGSN